MEQQSPNQNQAQSISYPNQNDGDKALASIASLLKEAEAILPLLRREFRGEAIQQYEDGNFEYIQVSKPLFVKLDVITEQPLKKTVTYRSGETKEVYIANDEAIEEVLSILKFMGMNKMTLLTNIKEDMILDDLLEFECKFAAVLAIKQKSWGIDKELLPMIMIKIKTIVQDARYMACQGNTIKAIQKTVQRVESYYEGDNPKNKKRGGVYA